VSEQSRSALAATAATEPETIRKSSVTGLVAELESVRWVQQEVREGRPLPAVETATVVASLHIAMRPEGRLSLPLLHVDDMNDYLAVHALNVAMLAMALSEYVDFDTDATRKIGAAALLHDIGMTRMPVDLIAKPGQISASERDRIKEHPVEGARVIMAADISLELAATVAYEHHLKVDGSGYPKLTYPRPGHYVSRLVQLCDIYHALRSPRPFRQPWPREIIYSFLNERAGFEFHPALAAALTRMTQQLDPI
jgi:putative nucleotidyltransferase with HDIG domain